MIIVEFGEPYCLSCGTYLKPVELEAIIAFGREVYILRAVDFHDYKPPRLVQVDHMDAVAAAIAAHDGTPDPVPDTPDFSTNVPDNFALQIANQFRVVSDYIALPATQAAQATAFVPAIKAIGRLTLWLVRKNWTNGH